MPDREMSTGAIPVRLDHCVIAVSDWSRSNSFYENVLGAELVELDTGRYAYRFGEQQLNVHGPSSAPHPRALDPVRPGNSDLCFVWDGRIEDAVQRLGDLGVEIELGPVERIGARGTGTSVYFRDPDGSLLELISYTSPSAYGPSSYEQDH
jgi:catechol 2,3-dioxygenase-like lactoylglutathione lyase family enzyme